MYATSMVNPVGGLDLGMAGSGGVSPAPSMPQQLVMIPWAQQHPYQNIAVWGGVAMAIVATVGGIAYYLTRKK